MFGVNCVKAEIHNVLTVLRLTTPPSSRLLDDDALTRGLTDLYQTIGESDDLIYVDTRSYLAPFLHVIVAHNTDVQATGVALHSVHKFLVYGHITDQSPHAAEAVSNIAYYVKNCKFDARSRDDDEVVYMKVLEVLLECVRSSAGHLLADEGLCSIIEEAFKARNRRNASKQMRKYAENILMQLVLITFARLSDGGFHCPNPIMPSSRRNNGHSNGDAGSSNNIIPGITDNKHSTSKTSNVNNNVNSYNIHSTRHLKGAGNDHKSMKDSPIGQNPEGYSQYSPRRLQLPSVNNLSTIIDEKDGKGKERYGVSALVRILRFLTNLIDPNPNSGNDIYTRVFGLRLLRTVFETAGVRLSAHPELVAVIQDEMCKYVLQNSQSQQLFVLSLTLRLIFDMFLSVKTHLKVQLEVFFKSVHMRIGRNPSSTFEQKRLTLASLTEFCREPTLITGLYRNYDCDIMSTNLFEDLCRFLAAGGMPAEETDEKLTALHLSSFEGLMAVLHAINKRFCSAAAMHPLDSPLPLQAGRSGSGDWMKQGEVQYLSPEEAKAVDEARQHKKKLRVAAQRFNKEGVKSFEYLQSLRVLPENLTPEAVVHFFKTTPHLDKKKVGECLGSEKEFCQRCLATFVDTFDFETIPTTRTPPPAPGKLPIDDALRAFLDHFRLPGEAQQIGRILEQFARGFIKHCDIMADEDAAYVLAYSVIMLHTDAHNDGVKNKMTLDAYIKTTRGINGGKNFSLDYITDLYHSVTTNEIKLSEDTAFDEKGELDVCGKQWNRMVKKNSGEVFKVGAARKHGQEMFNLVWETCMTLFLYYLEQAPPDFKIIEKVTDGIFAFSRICAVYDLNNLFNNLIIALCKVVCRLLAEISSDMEHTPLQALGRNGRARQIATILFQLVYEYGEAHINEGWINVIEAILWFHHLDLLPASLLEMDDFQNSKGQFLDSLRDDPGTTESEPQQESWSLFSFWSSSSSDSKSSISAANSAENRRRRRSFLAPEDAKSPKVEETKDRDSDDVPQELRVWEAQAKECLDECKIVEIFASTKYFKSRTLNSFVRALLSVSTYGIKEQQMDGSHQLPDQIMNIETSVFCLERLCNLIEQNQERLMNEEIELWKCVMSHLHAAITQSHPENPTFFIERVVVNILRLGTVLKQASPREHLLKVISFLLDLSPRALKMFGERITIGLHLFIKIHAEDLLHISDWQPIFRILIKFKYHSAAARNSFNTIIYLVQNHMTVELFPPVYAMLNAMIKPTENADMWLQVRPKEILASMLTLHNCIETICTPPYDQKSEKSDNSVLDGAQEKIAIEGEPGSANLDRKANQRPHQTDQKLRIKCDLWLHSLQVLCGLCTDPRPEVHMNALDTLHKSILGSQVVMKIPLAWKICFEKLLVPLLDSVSRLPHLESKRKDPHAPDIRLRASNLLFQTFLHNLEILLRLPDFRFFWLKFIGSLERFMNSRTSNQKDPSLSLHFTESLKNVLLVMHATGAFRSASDADPSTSIGSRGLKASSSSQDLWALTWAVIDKFQPQLRSQLVASMNQSPPTSRVAQGNSETIKSNVPLHSGEHDQVLPGNDSTDDGSRPHSTENVPSQMLTQQHQPQQPSQGQQTTQLQEHIPRQHIHTQASQYSPRQASMEGRTDLVAMEQHTTDQSSISVQNIRPGSAPVLAGSIAQTSTAHGSPLHVSSQNPTAQYPATMLNTIPLGDVEHKVAGTAVQSQEQVNILSESRVGAQRDEQAVQDSAASASACASIM